MDNFYKKLITEQSNERSLYIDTYSTLEILQTINDEDMRVPLAVKEEIINIAKAVDAATDRIKSGGRLFYVGAGTSGRIGVLDAAECPPTYGTSPEMVQGIIAGGYEALLHAIEGAEDSEETGCCSIRERCLTDKDIVIGISASGSAPFVIGAIKEARALNALTVSISNNINPEIGKLSAISITPVAGPEVVAGSTRMKAGTAQKLVLNMISTAIMIKLGKVYGNLMVDVKPTNKKLLDRAERIIMDATSAESSTAHEYFELSGRNPKTAIVMIKTGACRTEAEELLGKNGGFVSRALETYYKNNAGADL